MKFSTRGRYALRVMMDMAANNTGEYIPLKDISSRQTISVKYLEQIMPLLTRAGFVSSSRGNNGGYKLARKPDQYTVGEILRTAEGSLAPIACLDDEPNQCPRSTQCETLAFWEGLWKVINEYIDSYTLADLAAPPFYAQNI